MRSLPFSLRSAFSSSIDRPKSPLRSGESALHNLRFIPIHLSLMRSFSYSLGLLGPSACFSHCSTSRSDLSSAQWQMRSTSRSWNRGREAVVGIVKSLMSFCSLLLMRNRCCLWSASDEELHEDDDDVEVDESLPSEGSGEGFLLFFRFFLFFSFLRRLSDESDDDDDDEDDGSSLGSGSCRDFFFRLSFLDFFSFLSFLLFFLSRSPLRLSLSLSFPLSSPFPSGSPGSGGSSLARTGPCASCHSSSSPSSSS